ncbi:hypothetical protein CYMTET_34603 [Cymbomonas tetramitiformis]|uniref:Uncharacterized protein n=1 Tax=Cymbomonas tetramitiformis TaxID=36881 RepID=A0AAE0FAW0_9CHLO|nr:hypothetical protein CYMTET_34603 [Cymbomonas tetramitiformis]
MPAARREKVALLGGVALLRAPREWPGCAQGCAAAALPMRVQHAWVLASPVHEPLVRGLERCEQLLDQAELHDFLLLSMAEQTMVLKAGDTLDEGDCGLRVPQHQPPNNRCQ